MTTVFEEGRQKFVFDDNWQVVKLDESLAFLRGTKKVRYSRAVDFVGIYKNQSLYFIEAKNYTNDLQQLKQDVKDGSLLDSIVYKVRDSFACIAISSQVIEGHFQLQPFREFLLRLSSQGRKRVFIIFWLEYDRHHIKSEVIRTRELRRKLSWFRNYANIAHSGSISVPGLKIENLPYNAN